MALPVEALESPLYGSIEEAEASITSGYYRIPGQTPGSFRYFQRNPTAQAAVPTPQEEPPAYQTSWYGPRQLAPDQIRSLEGGENYLQLQTRNTKGRAGFWEQFKFDDTEDLPFVGDVIGGAKLRQLPGIIRKLEAGEEVSDQEMLDLNLYIAESERNANSKFSGLIGTGIKEFMKFGVEFVGYGALVAKTAGFGIFPVVGALAKKASVKAGKEMAAATIKKYLLKTLGQKMYGKLATSATRKALTEGAIRKMVVGGATMTIADVATDAMAKAAADLPQTANRGIMERQIAAAFEGREESPEASWWYDLGDKWVEYTSEMSGELLGAGVKDVVGRPLGALVGKTVGTDYHKWGKNLLDKIAQWHGLAKYTGQTTEEARRAAAAAGKSANVAAFGAYLGRIMEKTGVNAENAIAVAEKMGYNGWAGEMLEERFGGAMRGLLGIQGDEASLKNAWDQMWPDARSLAAEAVTFSLPMVTASGINIARNSKWLGGSGELGSWQERLQKTILANTPATGKIVDYDSPITRSQAEETQAAKVGSIPAAVSIARGEFMAKKEVADRPAARALDFVLRMAESVAVMSPYPMMYGSSFDRALSASGVSELVRAYGQAYYAAKTEAGNVRDAQGNPLSAEEIEARAMKVADGGVAEIMAHNAEVALIPTSYLGETPEESAKLIDAELAKGDKSNLVIATYRGKKVVFAKSAISADEAMHKVAKKLRLGVDLDLDALEAAGETDTTKILRAFESDITADDLAEAAKDPTSETGLRVMRAMQFSPFQPELYDQFRKAARAAYEARARAESPEIVNGSLITLDEDTKSLYRTNIDSSGRVLLTTAKDGQPVPADLKGEHTVESLIAERGAKKVVPRRVIAMTPVRYSSTNVIKLADVFEGYVAGEEEAETGKPVATYQRRYDQAGTEEERDFIRASAIKYIKFVLNGEELGKDAAGKMRYAIGLGATNHMTRDGGTIIAPIGPGMAYHTLEDLSEVKRKEKIKELQIAVSQGILSADEYVEAEEKIKKGGLLSAQENLFLDQIHQWAVQTLKTKPATVKPKEVPEKALLQRLRNMTDPSNPATRAELINKIFLQRELGFQYMPGLPMADIVSLLPNLYGPEFINQATGQSLWKPVVSGFESLLGDKLEMLQKKHAYWGMSAAQRESTLRAGSVEKEPRKAKSTGRAAKLRTPVAGKKAAATKKTVRVVSSPEAGEEAGPPAEPIEGAPEEPSVGEIPPENVGEIPQGEEVAAPEGGADGAVPEGAFAEEEGEPVDEGPAPAGANVPEDLRESAEALDQDAVPVPEVAPEVAPEAEPSVAPEDIPPEPSPERVKELLESFKKKPTASLLEDARMESAAIREAAAKPRRKIKLGKRELKALDPRYSGLSAAERGLKALALIDAGINKLPPGMSRERFWMEVVGSADPVMAESLRKKVGGNIRSLLESVRNDQETLAQAVAAEPEIVDAAQSTQSALVELGVDPATTDDGAEMPAGTESELALPTSEPGEELSAEGEERAADEKPEDSTGGSNPEERQHWAEDMGRTYGYTPLMKQAVSMFRVFSGALDDSMARMELVNQIALRYFYGDAFISNEEQYNEWLSQLGTEKDPKFLALKRTLMAFSWSDFRTLQAASLHNLVAPQALEVQTNKDGNFAVVRKNEYAWEGAILRATDKWFLSQSTERPDALDLDRLMYVYNEVDALAKEGVLVDKDPKGSLVHPLLTSGRYAQLISRITGIPLQALQAQVNAVRAAAAAGRAPDQSREAYFISAYVNAGVRPIHLEVLRPTETDQSKRNYSLRSIHRDISAAIKKANGDVQKGLVIFQEQMGGFHHVMQAVRDGLTAAPRRAAVSTNAIPSISVMVRQLKLPRMARATYFNTLHKRVPSAIITNSAINELLMGMTPEQRVEAIANGRLARVVGHRNESGTKVETTDGQQDDSGFTIAKNMDQLPPDEWRSILFRMFAANRVPNPQNPNVMDVVLPESFPVPILTGDKQDLWVYQFPMDQIKGETVEALRTEYLTAQTEADREAMWRRLWGKVYPEVTTRIRGDVSKLNDDEISKRSAQTITPIVRPMVGLDGGLDGTVRVAIFDDHPKMKVADGYGAYGVETMKRLLVSFGLPEGTWHALKIGFFGRASGVPVNIKPLTNLATDKLAAGFKGSRGGLGYGFINYLANKWTSPDGLPVQFAIAASAAKLLPPNARFEEQEVEFEGVKVKVKVYELPSSMLGITSPTSTENADVYESTKDFSWQAATNMLGVVTNPEQRETSYQIVRELTAAVETLLPEVTVDKLDPQRLINSELFPYIGALIQKGVSAFYPMVQQTVAYARVSKLMKLMAAKFPGATLIAVPYLQDTRITADPENRMRVQSLKDYYDNYQDVADYGKAGPVTDAARAEHGAEGASTLPALILANIGQKRNAPVGLLDGVNTEGMSTKDRERLESFAAALVGLRETSGMFEFGLGGIKDLNDMAKLLAWMIDKRGLAVDMAYTDRLTGEPLIERVDQSKIKTLADVLVNYTGKHIRAQELLALKDSEGRVAGVRVPGSLIINNRSPVTGIRASVVVGRLHGSVPGGGRYIMEHPDIVARKGKDFDFDQDHLITAYNESGVPIFEATTRGDMSAQDRVAMHRNRAMALWRQLYDQASMAELQESINPERFGDALRAYGMLPTDTAKKKSDQSLPETFFDALDRTRVGKSGIGLMVTAAAALSAVLAHMPQVSIGGDNPLPEKLVDPKTGKTLALTTTPMAVGGEARLAVLRDFINLVVDAAKLYLQTKAAGLDPESVTATVMLNFLVDHQNPGPDSVATVADFMRNSELGRAFFQTMRDAQRSDFRGFAATQIARSGGAHMMSDLGQDPKFWSNTNLTRALFNLRAIAGRADPRFVPGSAATGFETPGFDTLREAADNFWTVAYEAPRHGVSQINKLVQAFRKGIPREAHDFDSRRLSAAALMDGDGFFGLLPEDLPTHLLGKMMIEMQGEQVFPESELLYFTALWGAMMHKAINPKQNMASVRHKSNAEAFLGEAMLLETLERMHGQRIARVTEGRYKLGGTWYTFKTDFQGKIVEAPKNELGKSLLGKNPFSALVLPAAPGVRPILPKADLVWDERGPFEKLRDHVIGIIFRLQESDPGNAFGRALVVTGNKIEAYDGVAESPEQLQSLWNAFDTAAGLTDEDRAVIMEYSIRRHGLMSSASRGNLMPLISPAFHKTINDRFLELRDRVKSNPADLVRLGVWFGFNLRRWRARGEPGSFDMLAGYVPWRGVSTVKQLLSELEPKTKAEIAAVEELKQAMETGVVPSVLEAPVRAPAAPAPAAPAPAAPAPAAPAPVAPAPVAQASAAPVPAAAPKLTVPANLATPGWSPAIRAQADALYRHVQTLAPLARRQNESEDVWRGRQMFVVRNFLGKSMEFYRKHFPTVAAELEAPAAPTASMLEAAVLAATLATATPAERPALAAPPEREATANWRDILESRLLAHEGKQLKAYDDRGVVAIGPGYRMYPERKAEFERRVMADFDKVKAGQVSLTEDQYARLMQLAMDQAVIKAQANIANFDIIPERVKPLVVELAHWGVVPAFKKATEAIRQSNWDAVAAELRDSKAYRESKGMRTRLENLAQMFELQTRKDAAPTASMLERSPMVDIEKLPEPLRNAFTKGRDDAPDWNAILTGAADRTSSPLIRTLINDVLLNPRIQQIRSDTIALEVNRMPVAEPDGRRLWGHYRVDVDQPTITIEQANIELGLAHRGEGNADLHVLRVLVHEYLHDLSYFLVETDPGFKAEIARLRLLAQDAATDKDMYGFTDEHEFISELFSNKKFQDFLKGVTDTKKQTLWGRFVDGLRKAIAKVVPGIDNTVLGSALDAVLSEFEAMLGDAEGGGVAAIEAEALTVPSEAPTASVQEATSIPHLIDKLAYKRLIHGIPPETQKAKHKAATDKKAEIHEVWAPFTDRMKRAKTADELYAIAKELFRATRGRSGGVSFPGLYADMVFKWAVNNMPGGHEMAIRSHREFEITDDYKDPQLQFNFDAEAPQAESEDDDTGTLRREDPLNPTASVMSMDSWWEAIGAYRTSPGVPAMQKTLQREMNWTRSIINRSSREREYLDKYWGLYGDHVWGMDPDNELLKMPFAGLRSPVKLTDAERSEIMLARNAAGAIMEHLDEYPSVDAAVAAAKVFLPRSFRPDSDQAKAILPESIRKQMLEVDTTDAAWRLESADGQSIYYVPAQVILDFWTAENSTAKAKLLSAGRKETGPKSLDIKTLAQYNRERFAREEKEIRDHVWSVDPRSQYLWHRDNYLPHYYRFGFLGADEKRLMLALQRDIDQTAEDVEAKWEQVMSKRHPNNRPTRRQLVTLLRLRGMTGLGADTTVERMEQLEKDFFAGRLESEYDMGPGMTYADVAVAIRNEVHSVLMDRKQRIANGEKGVDLNSPVSGFRNPLAGAKHMDRVVATFNNREFSGRVKPRKFQTFEHAALARNWRPLTQDPVMLHHRYVSDLMTATMNRVTLSQLANMTDIDGKPLVIVEPNEEFPDPSDSIFTQETWDSHLMQLARYWGASVDPKKTTMENIRSIIAQHEPARAGNYVEVESQYPSVLRFYAAKDRPENANVMDMFVGGEVAGILKHLVGQNKKMYLGNWDILNTLAHINAWMKTGSLQFSLFFAKSAMESVIAGTGLKRNILWHPKQNFLSLKEIREKIQNGDPEMVELMRKWEEAGMEISVSGFDTPFGFVQKDVDKFGDYVSKNFGQVAGRRARDIVNFFTTAQGEFLFNDIFTVSKVWAANRMYDEFRQRAKEQGNLAEFDRLEMDTRRRLAVVINDAYGGQDKNRYSWWTPGMHQFLNLTMFAPNWTLSAWNVAGGGMLTGPILKNYMGNENMKFVFGTNWPAMLLLVLMLDPILIQLASYLMGGDPDEGDKPFPWQNETERTGYADVTPLLRSMPWYKGDPTGKRRHYIRYGKQSYEVIDGWLSTPMAQLLRKTSQPVRLAWELSTGKSPGSEWDLEFRNQGVMGLIQDRDGNFSGSRLGYVVNKFLPFSFLSWAKTADARPLSFVAGLSKGMSIGKATQMMEGYMRSYVYDENYNIIRNNPKIRHNLEALGPELLKAVELNGYDPDKVVQSAKGAILRDLYAKFYKAFGEENTKDLEKYAKQILRLNGTTKTVMRSMGARRTMYGKPADFSEDELRIIEEAFK